MNPSILSAKLQNFTKIREKNGSFPEEHTVCLFLGVHDSGCEKLLWNFNQVPSFQKKIMRALISRSTFPCSCRGSVKP